VDAVLGMRRDGLRADEIEGVTVRGSAIHVTQLSKQSVETTLDAQMSLPYAISVALLSGGAGFDQFDQAALRRPEVRAFAKRVNVVREQAVADGEEPFVDIALKDGRVLTDRVLVARGDATNPLGEDELRAKFRSTAGVALPPEQVEELENVIDNVAEAERLDALVALLAPRTGETIQRRSVA
jgi:2-methylcitrate dehydratase PrpD